MLEITNHELLDTLNVETLVNANQHMYEENHKSLFGGDAIWRLLAERKKWYMLRFT